jgi:hypothetical protein
MDQVEQAILASLRDATERGRLQGG